MVRKSKKFSKTIGTRAEVFHGTAEKTGYGKDALKKKDLLKNKSGRIVSRKKHMTAKKEKRLEKHGFYAEKGKFGFIKKTPKAAKRTTRKVRGQGKGKKN